MRRRSLNGWWAAGLCWPALAQAASASASAPGRETADDGVRRGRVLRFPQDHGAHTGVQTEWWYLTGWLESATGDLVEARPAPRWGFQITFFRSSTGLAAELPGRFAPRQLLFAHAALTDLGGPGQPASHRHDQRLARWDGLGSAPLAHASRTDADLALLGWRLWREATGNWRTEFAADGFELALGLRSSQPLLLQGDAGFSRKGPAEQQASHYVSQPQLLVQGRLRPRGGADPGASPLSVQGRAWLDHEWSDSLLAPEAQGWDWLGINLFDGSALTAFRLRARDARGPGAGQPPAPAPIWSGGSFRTANGAMRQFQPGEVGFEAGPAWTSPQTGATYPVRWRLTTPVGTFTLVALFNAQELDSRASTGTVYWEGLAELLDGMGRRVGLGYLEMTGYAGRVLF